ncbi:MAG: type III PLP-dependent enzyme [Ferrovibrio sp.]|uniref:type III PLP-dependent enzyme n=1 Tax=Ferrovibrio sp. TaxID=1917215 RepID=UPI00261E8A6A|nr:type III PLP-dependent enzyme [Ferrovibrio sp.]MCW0236461.1 type III PLP-dependent enzyme [Ferrovibrio sp.]
MTASSLRVAVTPLRRDPSRRRGVAPLPSVDAVVASLRPEEPLHCLRPAAITAAARSFVEAFEGRTLYAVKCNPEPRVLSALWRGGVKAFDCASPAEIAVVRHVLPEATIHYMHPVKARSAIRTAWRQHGVRDFAIDSEAELEKIFAETGATSDLGLIVRIALPKGKAALDLSGKFGIAAEAAPALLCRARAAAQRLGISFHVGSQCSDPAMWSAAIARAGDIAVAAGVKLDILDVGGGFPVAYPGDDLPPLAAFMAEIDAGADALRERLGAAAPEHIWAEPGRALVAQGASVVVQVQARRDSSLYINDGVYGSLADAGTLAWRFPLRLLRASTASERVFTLFGPTCDSLDRMDGGFSLPADVTEGDWIEIGQLGAYGATLRTAFNGFDRGQLVEVSDAPLLRTPGYAVI